MNDGHPISQPYSRAGLLAKLTGAAVLAAGSFLVGQGTSQLLSTGTGMTYNGGVLTVSPSATGRTVVGNSSHADGSTIVLQNSSVDWGYLGSYKYGIGSGNATDLLLMTLPASSAVYVAPEGYLRLKITRAAPGTPGATDVFIGSGAIACGGSMSCAALTAIGILNVTHTTPGDNAGYIRNYSATGYGPVFRGGGGAGLYLAAFQKYDGTLGLTITETGGITAAGDFTLANTGGGASAALTAGTFGQMVRWQRYGYSTSYTALQIGNATYSTSFGYDTSTNAGGQFYGDSRDIFFRRGAHIGCANAGGTDFEWALRISGGSPSNGSHVLELTSTCASILGSAPYAPASGEVTIGAGDIKAGGIINAGSSISGTTLTASTKVISGAVTGYDPGQGFICNNSNADFVSGFRLENGSGGTSFYALISGTTGGTFGANTSLFESSQGAMMFSAYGGAFKILTGSSRTERLSIHETTGVATFTSKIRANGAAASSTMAGATLPDLITWLQSFIA